MQPRQPGTPASMKIDSKRDYFHNKSLQKDLMKINQKLIQMCENMKTINRELLKENVRLLESNKLKSELISLLSHNIGTSLTVIEGNISLLLEDTFGKLSKSQKERLEIVQRYAKNIETLRKETIVLNKTGQGGMKLKKRDVNLTKIISQSVSDFRWELSEKNQKISIDLPHKLVSFCDEIRIKHLFDNILLNSIRFTKPCGEIRIKGATQKEGVLISIKDTGRGIEKDDLERIFDRFYTSGAKVEGSTGIGLAIVKGIIKMHNGRVWCESEVSKGSTFFVFLPKEE